MTTQLLNADQIKALADLFHIIAKTERVQMNDTDEPDVLCLQDLIVDTEAA
jgi:hypothetical protein